MSERDHPGRPRLLIPGPIELEWDTLQAMARPLLPHYGREWLEIYNRTRELLRYAFQTEHDVLLIPGSGSAGLEAALGSFLGDGETEALIISNGFFGQRLQEIAQSYAPTERVHVLEGEPNRPLPPERLAQVLTEKPRITLVAAVHCETSTGLLNPVRDYAQVCHDQGKLFMIDAISSLGGAELRCDEWGIDICVSASQKGLEAAPGLSLVALSSRAWEAILERETPGWYLNLKTWRRYAEEWADWHPYPVTLPISVIYGLQTSLERIRAEGLEERWARHRRMAGLLRRGLEELGFTSFVAEEHSSPTVTAARGRPDFPAERVIRELHRQGILISGGIGPLRGQIFRIGHMGPQASLEMLLPVLFALEEALRAAGLPVATETEALRDLGS